MARGARLSQPLITTRPGPERGEPAAGAFAASGRQLAIEIAGRAVHHGSRRFTMSINPKDGSGKPTIVLVHGAFAESASWAGVIRHLQERGYTAIAAPNPIRGIAIDAQAVGSVLRAIDGPIVLVGHSYGGAVISTAAVGVDAVKALVYVAGFAPDAGESIADLSSRFSGSTLPESLESVPLPDGTADLFIRVEKFHAQFAADVPADEAHLMAVTQRPLRTVALNERSGPPAWKTIPSWFVLAELDRNIPVAAHRFMAARARGREVLELAGASHAVAVSRPQEVAGAILRAAAAVEAATARPAAGAEPAAAPPA
jgi:pimeloyl-ACP methyl ester carboxylesterase